MAASGLPVTYNRNCWKLERKLYGFFSRDPANTKALEDLSTNLKSLTGHWTESDKKKEEI